MALRFSSGLLTGLQQYGQGGGIPADPRQRDLMQAAGVTNPLLQQFGKSVGGLFGVETRSPAAIQQAQDKAQELAQKEAEAKTQGLLLSQIEASTALTPAQKETYIAMIRSGDVNPQQVIDVIRNAEQTKQKESQTSAIKGELLNQGFTQEQLDRLTPEQLGSYAKSTIDQQRTQTQTQEGAATYLATLNLDPETAERASLFVTDDAWSKLTPAQRTQYFTRLEEDAKNKKQVENLTRMVASMPEGKQKQEAMQSLEDLKNGFVSASSVRDLIRAKNDPSITETEKVVDVGGGKLAKVANQQVNGDTFKVYYDETAKKYLPVTAEMFEKAVDKPKSGWASSESMKFVGEIALANEDVSLYLEGYDPWGFGDYRTTPEENLDRRYELATLVEKLKKDGKTNPEIKEEIVRLVRSKGESSEDNSAVLTEADSIISGDI